VPEQSTQVGSELLRLARTAYYRAECNVTASRFYSNTHTMVGMAAAGLAAAAGGTAFAGQTIIAGIAGILSAAVAGFLTISKPDELSQRMWRAATAYSELARDILLANGSVSRSGGEREPVRKRPRLQPEAISSTPQAENDENKAPPTDFEHRFRQLEQESFPVPKHLCRKAESFIHGQEGWYPPIEDFDRWWIQRSSLHVPWWKRWRAGGKTRSGDE
jgi:hypothetical protein